MEITIEEVAEPTAHRGSLSRAAAYTVATIPASVITALAVGSTYDKYTEFDRPSAFAVLLFLVASAVWCAAMVVVGYAPGAHVDLQRAATGFVAALLALTVLALIAPSAPTSQAAAMLAVAFLVPAGVLSAVEARGAVTVILRTVVGGIGFVVGVPCALLLVLVALTRGVPLPGAAAAAALVAHLPVTFLSAIVASGPPNREPRVAAPVEGAPGSVLRRFAPAALVVAAIIAASGVVARPVAPAERDPLLAEVAGAHRDLNNAVGWDAWNRKALDGTAARLDRAVILSDGAPELVDAAAHVRLAVDENDRQAAVIAHRIIAGFERNVRESRDLLAGG